MSALVSLVQRAAVITKPYKIQDAVLLIKALSALRLHRPEVKFICEKASFSLASSPAEVPTAVLVDAVHQLCTLQSAHLPVVQRVLVRRFCELRPKEGAQSTCHRTSTSSCSVNPRTAQKAALVLAKLGRHAGQEEATEHVLRLLHAVLEQEPDDAALHIAYVALYANSSRCTNQRRWWETAELHKVSSQTLQHSLTFILKNPQTFRRASGNVAWQLLHLLIVLPPQGSSPHILQGDQVNVFERHCSSGALAQQVSAGAYVHFVHAFGADVCRLDLRRAVTLLAPLARAKGEDSLAVPLTPRPLNVYDATKLVGALSSMFSVLAAHPSRSASLAAAGCPVEQPPGCHTFPGSDKFSLDKHEAWLAVVQHCFTILCDLVKWEQVRLRSACAEDDSLMSVVVSPDQFLVAALLDSYARGYAVALEQSDSCGGRRGTALSLFTSSASVSALLEFVPLLSEPPPTMISWMLRSLALLGRQQGVGCAQVERSAAFLLRWYLSAPSKKRCLRSNVETLYAYACLCGSMGGVQGRRRCFFSAAAIATQERPTSHRLPPLGALDSIIREVSSRLRFSHSTAPGKPQMEDVDMLLATLLHLHSSMFPAAEALATAPKELPEVVPLLGQLQSTLAAYYCDRALSASSVESAADVAVRAARLHVLRGLVQNAQFSCWRSCAVLAKAAERATEQVARMPSLVSSSSMLRALAVLGRGQQASVATSLSPTTFNASLLSTLCHRYQQYIGEVVQASGRREEVSNVVRVLWRARQAGVQLVFADSVHEDASMEANSVLFDVHDSRPQLQFPARLCRMEHLTCCAAADLLHLLAESQLNCPESVQLPPHTAYHLRVTLLDKLAACVDLECVIRLVRSNATPAISQVVFPQKEELHRLMRCVEVAISFVLHDAMQRGMADSAKGSRRGDCQEPASRLLHALAESQLFFRLPELASGEKSGGLRGRALQLAQFLEGSGRKADEVAVLKMRLLCGGAL
ncbi:hypothetical protein LSCM1_00552 [Leishmania martiniquensis]|uniref:Uncharacterized protein n=1 Tax=Leishmania martiniquensis TaxID=1580590 RepID=A0A836G1D9_9TRYP|nr:hypothetical protein LSCM1_00552 [Leishmania martiniquensis]